MPFSRVKSLAPRRSVFNLSHEVKLTCDMGLLIPVMMLDVVPGDSFTLGVEAVVRMMPLVTPFLHDVDITFHDWFVPYRLLWSDWEKFITKGVDGNDASVLPRWTPANQAVGSLWDYCCFPLGAVAAGALPVDFPRRAYNFIYNTNYRDETQIAEVALTNETILKRAWRKDYFTSALPWQQRGTAPALPVAGTSHAVWADSDFYQGNGQWVPNFDQAPPNSKWYVNSGPGLAALKDVMNKNTVDLAPLTTFSVSDLRLAFQIQKWQERNARAGVRYVEFLLAHYGVAPKDDRLQRPEYIGGAKFGVMVSEVVQHSETGTTPLGTMGGHGLTAGREYCGKYRAVEHGIIMRIMSIMPSAVYDSQGVDRQWLAESPFDYYSPEFANLSEQPIYRAELYADNVEAHNRTVFGYQGKWDHLRYRPSKLAGLMRTDAAGSLAVWHMARSFSSAPSLNQTFIEAVPTKRVFVATSQPGCLVNIGNAVKAVRPLPMLSEPGLIDHS